MAAPHHRRDNVSRLLLGIGGQMRQVGITIRPAEINGQPGAVFLDRTAT